MEVTAGRAVGEKPVVEYVNTGRHVCHFALNVGRVRCAFQRSQPRHMEIRSSVCGFAEAIYSLLRVKLRLLLSLPKIDDDSRGRTLR